MSSNTITAPAVSATAPVTAAAALAPSLISGTSAAETLGGTAGADEIFGYGQNDLINAGDANDTLWGGNGDDTLNGGAGDDLLVGEGGNDRLDGGLGSDTYRVTGNAASGFGGHDTYADTGSSGVDRVVVVGTGAVDIGIKGWSATGIEQIDATGTTGAVRLLDTGDANLIDLRTTTLTGSNLVIDGNYGDDTIYGSAAGDTIVASFGHDVVDGGEGGDTYRISGNEAAGWGVFQNHDTYKDTGSAGTDQIVVAGTTTGAVDIGIKGWSATGIEQIDATGTTGVVRLLDTGDSNLIDLRTTTLTGSNLVIDGNYGNDTVHGSAAADTIVGASGNDVLDGGAGGDTCRVTGNEAGGWSSFHSFDTYADTGTSGIDRIVALGTGDVDVGFLGSFGASSGIEEIDATGVTGTVRLYGEGSGSTLDFRNVTITGGNVVIDSSYGNDTVHGSAGADTILASWGDDVFDGAGGSDTYRVSGNATTAFQGHDTYKDSGTAGTDKIVVTGGTLAVDIGIKGWSATGIEQVDATGTTGAVRLLDTYDANLIDLRTTTLTGSNLVIDASFGNDTVYGSAAADTLVSGGGNDVVDGGAGGDTYRVTGNEAGGWSSFQNFDTYADTGTSGTDKIVALGTGNVDIGLLGNFGPTSGIEAVDGSGATGTVRLYGDGSATTLDFRAVTVTGANVVIDSNSGNDTVYGTAGADTILTSHGDDVLDGAGGSDTFRVTGNTTTGFQGHDTYKDSGTAGTDKIVALGTGDVDIGLLGSFGAGSGIETIDASGATGNVRLLGDNSASTLDFRTVTLTGTRLVIDAGNGNDVVYGSAGADTLVSHNGEDTVDGAGGADIYRVSGNTTTGFHGYDTFKDSGTTGTDKIVVTGGTLAVDIGIKGWSATGIEQVDATGTTGAVRLLDTGDANLLDFRTATLTGSNLVIDAAYGNDTVYGSAGNDTLVSNHGEDLLDGAGGSDTYRVTGNAAATFHGRDTYKDSGTSGTDTVMALGAGDVDIGVHDWQGTGIEVVDGTGAAGRVRLWANDSANLLDFSTTTFVGSNILIDGAYGSDTIKGSAGNDVILGGADADLLDGQDGSDTYRVTGNRAAGWNSFHHFDRYADTGTTGTDKIVALGTGDVDIGVAGWQSTGIEVVDATGATGLVRLLGRDEADVMDFRTTTLVGANLVIDGGYSNDTIFGSAGADTIIGAGNDDLVDGAEEGDTFRVTGNVAGGWSSFQGYDTYSDTGTTGIDRLVALGGAVDIGLAGWQNTGVETIDATGATGTVRLLGGDDATWFDFSTTTLTGSNLLIDGAWGSDTLVGSAAADQIVGGGGDDRLDGFEGSDTYQVTGNQAEGWRSFQGFDTYQDTGTTGIDTLHAQGAGDVDIGLLNFDVSSGIEVIDTRDVVGQTRIVGSWSDDVLDFSGTSILGSRVVIDGSGGTDVVFGSAGDDTIIGGSGADSMAGGMGNDVYRVGRGASLDVIWDYDETAGNQDVIEFGPDIAIDQLWFQRLDGFLEVSVIGSWDRVYVMDWDTGPASQVEQFRTADGHVLLNTQVDTLISAMAAFDAPSGGTTTLPEAYRAALVPLITSTWS